MIYTEISSNDKLKTSAPKPTLVFLVILNGLLFFCALAIPSTLFGLILAVPATIFFMLVSGLIQAIIRKIAERNFYLKPIPRILAYTSPFLLLLFLLLLLACLGIKPSSKPNKARPAITADGKMEAYVSSPSEGWRIKISNKDTGRTWTHQTDFVSHLNIYWIWDSESRFWIYNSDDGSVYFMDRIGDEWKIQDWGNGRTKLQNIPDSLIPPYALYPDYVKNENL